MEFPHARAPLTERVRAVAVFHLVTEGVLALRAQRLLIAILRRFSVLDGIRAGFTAMLRDEARHVSFGLHSLRVALRQGHEEVMLDVLHTTLPLIMAIDVPAATRAPSRPQVRTARQILNELDLRLRQVDASARTREQLSLRGQQILDTMQRAQAV